MKSVSITVHVYKVLVRPDVQLLQLAVDILQHQCLGELPLRFPVLPDQLGLHFQPIAGDFLAGALLSAPPSLLALQKSRKEESSLSYLQ